MARALGLDPDGVLDLSASFNPVGPDVAALAGRHLGALRRYPDERDASRLLAEALGVAPEGLVLTNGGSEAIALVAGAVGGRVAAEPEFSLHPRGVDGPTWRSDPRTPTGRLAPADERADVWDEAYYPLATGRWSAHRPGVVIGSLTKVFTCPGLRLGYVVADEVERLTSAQPAWSVNGLALALLPDLLAAADLPAWRASTALLRADLVDVLARHGLVAEAADAPWVLVDAPGLRDRLAPLGIVVRDCASFGLPGHVRVAVPDEWGLARLDAALARVDPTAVTP